MICDYRTIASADVCYKIENKNLLIFGISRLVAKKKYIYTYISTNHCHIKHYLLVHHSCSAGE